MRRLLILTAVFLLILTIHPAAQAGPRKDGPGFQVNAYTSGSGAFPSVARMPGGEFVVVWTEFGPAGPLVKGRFVDGAGAPASSEFQVSTYTTSIQFAAWPDVAVDGDGDFVVTWGVVYSGGPYGAIFARRFDSAGAPQDPSEFVVNSSTIALGNYVFAYLSRPGVASEAGGDFVVTWNNTNGYNASILARRFDSGGSPAGSEFLVSNFTTISLGLTPDIAMDALGNFMVVWGDFDPPDVASGAFARRFNSAGTALDPAPFKISAGTTGYPVFPSVGVREDGDFVVVWHRLGSDPYGPSTIRGRRVDSSGALKGSEFQVAGFTTSTGMPDALLEPIPEVSVDADGAFVVVWDDPLDKDGDGSGIFGRRFKRNGDRLDTKPFLVNSYTSGGQLFPSVALEEDGGFLVVWAGDGATAGSVFDQKLRRPGNCGDYDTDGDGLGEACDIVVTKPADGTILDCSPANRPTIRWRKGSYDRFRAMIAWDPSFGAGLKVTSGRSLITERNWTPTRNQWNRVCDEATFKGKAAIPEVYIRVFGVDTDVNKSNPYRQTFSNEIGVYVGP